MRILLIGGSGQLGSDLLRNNPGHEIYAPTHAEIDLCRVADLMKRIARHDPHMVINCAAFHNVSLCEEQPEQAFLVNSVAVRDLAALCAARRMWFITFSSDYVFGGEKREPYFEDDKPSPLQIYGITRLAGEHAAFASAPDRSVVIRTCGLYGLAGARSKGGNFVDGRVAEARSGKRIEMAVEQVVAPTCTDDLSRAVFELLEHSSHLAGIYHLVNEGCCSWYEFTRAIVAIMKLESDVIPVDRGGRTGNMRRPVYSVLGNSRARSLGVRLRPWREALEAYLQAKYPEAFLGEARGQAGLRDHG